MQGGHGRLNRRPLDSKAAAWSDREGASGDRDVMTLLDLLARSAGRVPHRPALVFRERRLLYADLLAGVRRIGGRLQALGVTHGDRVLLVLPNIPEFGASYLGILAAGATVVPLNPQLKADEVRYVLEDAQPTAIICSHPVYPLLQAARQGLGRAVAALVPDAPADGVARGDVGAAGSPDVEGFAPPPIQPSDVAACLYTSGTTGRPKGTLLTHGNLLANIESFRQILPLTEEDVFLTVLPLFHAFAATVMFLQPLSVGATIVLEPRFVPDIILQAIAQHRVTHFAGVPSMFAMLANLPRPVPSATGGDSLGAADFSAWRLCISGGAPLPPAVLAAFEAKFGVPIYEGYGPTECSPVLTVNPPLGVRKIGSVGPAIPQVELRVVDDLGNPLPAGEVGEIVARGPNVMQGYLNRPEETAEVLRDGWFHTGDLGRVDQDGYYYILDRKKDMIIVGGLNVYPREVEQVLGSHPAVAEAAVIGVPDAVRGEVPKALIVLRDAQTAGPQEILQWCRQRLANYKVPRTVEFVPQLPKTATGKIIKALLKARC